MKSMFAMQKSLLLTFMLTIINVGYFPPTYAGEAAATPAKKAAPPAMPAAAVTATIPAPVKAPTAVAPSLPMVAQAIWVKGAVVATGPDNAPRVLTRRAAVYEHDVVSTDKTSTGEIGFTDGSLMALAANSAVKIDEYKFKKGAGSTGNRSVIALVKGGFRTITGAIPKENPDGYKINTPVATIGVRGTEFITQLSPVQGLLLKIERGAIVVMNGGGTMDLTKCSSGSSSCENYGLVKSFDIKPQTSSTMPAEFANSTVPITSVPVNWGSTPKSTTPESGGSSQSPSNSGTSGPAKSVGSFCVG